MTEKEKANHLVETYYNVWAYNNTFTYFKDAQIKKTKAYKMSIRSAGIAIEEIIDAFRPLTPVEGWDEVHEEIDYWKKVKEEINNL